VWGVITVSRTTPDDPFPPGAETRLADFAGLIATAIANADARHELAALAEEQAALRRVATLVAGGKPQAEVLEAVAREAAGVFDAEAVQLLRWTGVPDEVVVESGWAVPGWVALPRGALYHPGPGSATLCVLETGEMCRAEESSRELGTRSVIAAPVIVNAELLGAIAAFRSPGRPFAPGTEVRLRSFGDLAAQAVANEAARDALRASRARIVRAADDERRKLERNLHDGAQQRLVAVLIQLRLTLAKLPDDAQRASELLQISLEELTQAIEELRELARGIHPAILTERGLGAALRLLGERAPFDVTVEHDLQGRLPAAVEAAAYYVAAEALTNVAKHAGATAARVRVEVEGDCARVDVSDDGSGGADLAGGSGLRGLADRVEALEGRFTVESPPGEGTRVVAEIPLGADDARA
ncbi:MAG TPA: GAF domain-containing protein, partial [Gaiellaceae bacterium]|nr:GAF domain-containing protein [Gaiellaceae bacterium]